MYEIFTSFFKHPAANMLCRCPYIAEQNSSEDLTEDKTESLISREDGKKKKEIRAMRN